ncbi:hypothetical protein LCGC14_2372210, partial [marine sediment metagenome]
MSRMTFKTIYTDVQDISVVKVSSKLPLIKRGIQAGLDILVSKDLPYLMTDGLFPTIAIHNTGNVDVTNGSATVSGGATSPVFTLAMVGRKFRIDGDNTTYRIKAFVSSTEITLETAYVGSTDTDASYQIHKDEYRLAPDMATHKVMRQVEDQVAMNSIEATAFDILEPSARAEGSPRFDILVGSKLDIYNTGTISGTSGAVVITGSSTVWTGVEGLANGSRLTVGTEVYTIKSVDTDTQVTIYETLASTISAGTNYEISMDNMRLKVFPIPDVAEIIKYRYQRLAFPLIADTDLPDLPDEWHHVLVTAGLITAYQTKDKDEA